MAMIINSGRWARPTVIAILLLGAPGAWAGAGGAGADARLLPAVGPRDGDRGEVAGLSDALRARPIESTGAAWLYCDREGPKSPGDDVSARLESCPIHDRNCHEKTGRGTPGVAEMAKQILVYAYASCRSPSVRRPEATGARFTPELGLSIIGDALAPGWRSERTRKIGATVGVSGSF